jgi:hypothetical protein
MGDTHQDGLPVGLGSRGCYGGNTKTNGTTFNVTRFWGDEPFEKKIHGIDTYCWTICICCNKNSVAILWMGLQTKELTIFLNAAHSHFCIIVHYKNVIGIFTNDRSGKPSPVANITFSFHPIQCVENGIWYRAGVKPNGIIPVDTRVWSTITTLLSQLS